MLDKKDLKAMEEVFDARFDVKIKNALTEFFETLLLPYFDRNEDDHKEIKQILNKHEVLLKEHGKLLERHDLSLDKLYRKAEKNEDDHEEMFKRLGKVERLPTKLPSKN